jgi:methylenetetrahydrofolate--tRNA-(uracil-5-)-methyltransferase
MRKVNIVGAGLAGVEACYFFLKRNYEVHLYEKRPSKMTPAHVTGNFGELVCSNSLKSNRLDNACGLLKEEMRHMDSLTMKVASETCVPSGNALSVDRDEFSQKITEILRNFPNLIVHEEEIDNFLDGPTLIATGPLTGDKLAKKLSETIGQDSLFFFDASAPIVLKDSIDMKIAFKKARYDQGDDSYINCPFSEEQYNKFYDELINAQVAMVHDFDKNYFEGCMPIEVMAKRGKDTLRYGPMKPKGLQVEGREKFHAVIQLRQDNLNGDLYNIVGFQTNLTYPEQKRVFRMIPGLENAEFVRYGLMHRNTYICSPIALNKDLSLKARNDIFLAGQLIGVEGYVESAAMGILAATFLYEKLEGKDIVLPSLKTMLGSLYNFVVNSNPQTFQPMNANFGILYGADKHNREENIKDSLKLTDEFWSKVNDRN